MGCLNERTVIVTGGGRGVGRAHALACASEGASVWVVDLGCGVDGEGADESVAVGVAEEIREQGGVAEASAIDVCGAGAAGEIISAAMERFGRLDAVIAAHGVSLERSVLKLEPETLVRSWDVHVRASFELLQASARAMMDEGRPGSIVLHTGAQAFFGALRQSAAAASHAAIVGLTRSAALELRRHGIRVNAIAPTARTRATEGLPLFQGINDDSMRPAEVAPLAVFLASELSRDVTGEILGAAGSRLYALTARETPGAFAEDGLWSPEAIARSWPSIVRG